MSDDLTRLFERFDRGTITRRQLLQALGIVVAGAPFANSLLTPAQGRCGGANAGTPACDTTPAPAPFAVTGWRTVALDHFTLQVADYQKEAAYYAALMNWKVRSDDGKQAVLDIGDDVGSVVIRGGYEPPPAPAPTGGGGGGGGGGGNRPPRRAVWDSFCWAIEPWDTKKVESELKKRGLNPVAANEGKDFKSFIVTAPDGFTVQISNGHGRRMPMGSTKVYTTAPFENTNWKTIWLDHISYQSPSYKHSVAFYCALLGWSTTGDEGSQSDVLIGDVGNILIRGGGPPRANQQPTQKARIDHISFGIEGFDPDAVKAELDKRGLDGRPDTGGRGDIHEAPYKSYHTTTPNGFDLQISNRSKASRNG